MKIALSAALSFFLFCSVAFAAPGENMSGYQFSIHDYVEKSTSIEKRFFQPKIGMTVRLSTVFWNDSENENAAAYEEFTFFEVSLRKRGFVKDYRPACEWDEATRSSRRHCSIESQVYDEANRKTVIVVDCNNRPGKKFDESWSGAPGSALQFFDEERRAIFRE